MDHDEKPAKTPHLHVRSVDGFFSAEAIAITGNAKALLQLRRQIDRALANTGESVPIEEEIYNDVLGQPVEVAVKRARSPEEMQEPSGSTKPEKTPERLPWAELARRTEEERRGGR